jgi:phospholipid transport system substrate-binding protein
VNLAYRLLVAVVIVVLLPAASTSTSEAEKRLQVAISDVVAVADRSPNSSSLAGSLRPVLEKYISCNAMTRRAIGPGWRQFSADQQSKATQLFTTLLIRTYSRKLTPGEYPEIKFKTASAPAPGRVEIPTTLNYKGSKYNVTYRMEESEGWRITDVLIEGVSFVANYRTQFDAQFKKGGSTAVIDALSQSVANVPK